MSLVDALGLDHVNPRSWIGDVAVGNVDLQEEWDRGREDAAQVVARYFPHMELADWASLFAKTGCDLMRPKGIWVGVSGEEGDKR